MTGMRGLLFIVVRGPAEGGARDGRVARPFGLHNVVRPSRDESTAPGGPVQGPDTPFTPGAGRERPHGAGGLRERPIRA
ncbi:hypothetical protein GCM10019016_124880 [Streptomyces prasinosporus]|uniref:Uncharacterized protein n=1 Tax=Streptomyces prasinosporus TaxID=68256 RepID=A0ABP6UCG4_9ACTN